MILCILSWGNVFLVGRGCVLSVYKVIVEKRGIFF